MNECPVSISRNSPIATACSDPVAVRAKVSVKATDAGLWPVGMSWTMLKDATDSMEDKAVLYTMSNSSLLSSSFKNRCTHFVSFLCLRGEYIMYVVVPEQMEGGHLNPHTSSSMSGNNDFIYV